MPFDTISTSVKRKALVQSSVGLSGFPGSSYRFSRFRGWANLLHYGGLIDMEDLQEMHWNMNVWTDDEVNQWKQSQLATYNAITVASAIFASIGLTALQLPNMYDVHWIVRALCASSMALGILSVSAATSLYQSMARLNDALSLRLRLSRGRPTPHADNVNNWWSLRFHLLTGSVFQRAPMKTSIHGKYDGTPFETLPLESAISALGSIWLPRHLLDLAVAVFLVGFGLYFLFLWLEDIGSAGTAHRDAFLLYIVVLVLMLLYWTLVQQGRQWNQAKAARDVGLSTSGPGSMQRNEAMKALRDELAACQQLLRSTQHELDKTRSIRLRKATKLSDEDLTGDTPLFTAAIRPNV